MAKGRRDSPIPVIKTPFLGETVPLNDLQTSNPAPGLIPCEGAIGGCQNDNDKSSNVEHLQENTNNNWIQLDRNEFTQQEIGVLLRKANPAPGLIPCEGAIGGCQNDNDKSSNVEHLQENTNNKWIQLDRNEFTQQEIGAPLRKGDPDSTRTHGPPRRALIQNYFRTQSIEEDCEGKLVPSGKHCFPSYPRRGETDEALYPSGGGFKEDSQKQEKQEELWIDIHAKDVPLREIHKRHQRERKTIPETECGPFHHVHSNVEQTKITEEDKTALQKNVDPCIGKIMFKDQSLGTCICIGASGQKCCCITPFHVIQSAIDKTDKGTEEECYQSTTIQFQCGRFYMKQIEQPRQDLDYARFELVKAHNCQFPRAWTKVGGVARDIKHPIYIVAYQDGMLEWEWGAKTFNNSVSDGLNKIKDYYRERFNLDICTSDDRDMKYHFVISTEFLPGSSGGLVLQKDQNGEFVGIGMVVCGYPKHYYTKLELKQKAEVKGCYLFELALFLEALQKDKVLPVPECCDQG